jgi:hypothetical protein
VSGIKPSKNSQPDATNIVPAAKIAVQSNANFLNFAIIFSSNNKIFLFSTLSPMAEITLKPIF